MGADSFHDAADGGVHGFDHGGVSLAVALFAEGLFGTVAGALEGVVGGVEGDVEKEGALAVAVDEGRGFGGDQVSEVAGVFEELLAVPEVGVELAVDVVEVVDVAGEVADEFVEALAGGEIFLGVAEVPFTEEAAGISASFKDFGEEEGIGGEAAGPFADVDDTIDAVALLVLAGEKGAAGGGADGAIGVGLGEVDAFGGEAVDMGGAEVFGAAEAEVSGAEVVGEEEDDIGGAFGLGAEDEGGAGEGPQGMAAVHGGQHISGSGPGKRGECDFADLIFLFLKRRAGGARR